MVKSFSLPMGFTLLALLASEAAAAPAGSNPPGANSSAGEAPIFIGGRANSAAHLRKAKTASGKTGSAVNTAGAKGATTVASRGGHIFLTRPSSVLLAAMKTRKPGRKLPGHGRSGHRAEDEIAEGPADLVPIITVTATTAIQPPPPDETVLSNPPPAPRIELNGSLNETPAVAPPAMNTATHDSQLPGADAPVQSHEPVVLTGDSVPLAKPRALASGGARGARGGVGALALAAGGSLKLNPAGTKALAVIGTLPGARARRGGVLDSHGLLLSSCALAALLLFIIGKQWLYRAKKGPWLSYTEDWVDGFLWRWSWRKGEVTNLRGFCPACQSEVILRPVATGNNAPSPSEPPGTWAFCPLCKEATWLETNDVSQTISKEVIRKKNSGEYQDAASRRKTGAASGRALRIKL